MNKSVNTSGGFDRWRIIVLYGLLAVVFGFFILRLFDMQIVNGQDYSEQAIENRTSNISVPTQRGNIYDRNGFILARNVGSYNVVITPAYLPADEGAIQAVYREVSELTGIPVNSGEINDDSVRNFTPCQTDLGITQIVIIGDTNAPYDPIAIQCNVSEDIAMVISERSADLQGVSIQVESIREYPTGELTAEVIGFLGPIPAVDQDYYEERGFVSGRDKVGYAGIEASMQDELGGTNGQRVIEVDNAGKEIRDLEDPTEAVPGYNVELTIDTRLQNVARNALVGEMSFWNTWLGYLKSRNGVVIAIKPKTGEIVALVSYPNYENNRMARVIPAYYYNQLKLDPYKPLFNHAISATHPPGSVYKLAAAIGALNEGVITPEKEIEDLGKVTVVQKFTPNDPGTPRDFVCYNRTGHGMVDFVEGVAQSCDVYFYKIGGGYREEVPEGLGIWRLGEYARALGYGAQTGIELPGEAAGIVPDPTWKRLNQNEGWSTGDTYIATIGQGYVTATPLEVLISAATVANDGKMMKPTLINKIYDQEGKVIQTLAPTLVKDITADPVINIFDENNNTTGEMKIVQPWVIQKLKEGMRMVVTSGTAADTFKTLEANGILSAGKTGTAEYCDNVAQAKNLCQPENWPQHAWYIGYAPFDDPEIAVVAFVYNGGEGASVAGPIVAQVLQSYFDLKEIDAAKTQIEP